MKKTLLTLVIIFTMSLVINAQMSDQNLFCSADNIPGSVKDGNKNSNASSNQSFQVSANPVEETVSVTFNVNANVESVKMINNNNSIVFETGKCRGAAGSVIDIPVEDMEAGTYFVRVQTESGVQVQRIIISK